MEVALFVPCYVDQLYPQVGMATVTLLERLGVKVHFPEAQTCCGQPMANAGFFDDARPLAVRMLEIFESYEHIVCPSGSCTSMVRNHYPELLPGARRLPVFDLVEFLHDVLKVLVNDVEIPLGVSGTNMTGTGWYNVPTLGARDGGFDLNFLDGGGQPAGDPYGSMAYLAVVVPTRLSSGATLPNVTSRRRPTSFVQAAAAWALGGAASCPRPSPSTT